MTYLFWTEVAEKLNIESDDTQTCLGAWYESESSTKTLEKPKKHRHF